MAQAGIHGMIGVAVRKWTPDRKWLMLGIVLGNLFPDADNLAVAVATVMGKSTEGLHRTFTHSLFFVAGIVLIGYVTGWASKKQQWSNLGLGLGVGILMHIVLDLFVWFNGVEILWPLKSWVNIWEGYTPPEWFMTLMNPLENLFFALYFILLGSVARKRNTNLDYLSKLNVWTWIQGILFVVFLVLAYIMKSGFMTIYGAVYLLSLGWALGVTIRMRDTVEAIA